MPAMGQSMTATGQTVVTCARCSQVQRQPYMAEFKVTRVQTLADGTTITREMKEIAALDSQGRRMNSNSMLLLGNTSNPDMMRTTVHDPVENTEANWDSRTRTARVIKLPPEDQRNGCWSTDSGNFRTNYGPVRLPDRQVPGTGLAVSGGGGASFESETATAIVSTPPGSSVSATMPVTAPGVVSSVPAGHVARQPTSKPVTEDLGTDVIQGVEVHGFRTTHTIPEGQIGNDRPIVTTDERWTAPSLGGLTLRSVSDSPQSGRQTRELVSLSIGDPDPSVFQPPEGYKVTVEEMHQVACEQQQ